MVRPQPRPSLAKAPTKEHPLAPEQTPSEPAGTAPIRGSEQASTLPPAGRRVPTAAASPGDASSPVAAAGPVLTMFATRLDADLRRQVKIHAAQQNQTIQEVTEAALRAYLEERPHR